MRSVVQSLKWVLVASGLGCQSIENDSFPLTLTEAARALDEMETTPKKLKRPLVVATGYLDPGVGSERLANVLRRGLQDDRVIAVDFFWCARFDECRDHLIRTVDEAFPTKDPLETTEVDVVAISMAGLVAGYASQDFPEKGSASPGRRLCAGLILLVALLCGPGFAVDFSSSNLPIVDIRTDGEPIPDEPKIEAWMGIIDNGSEQRNHIGDPFNGYVGNIGI